MIVAACAANEMPASRVRPLCGIPRTIASSPKFVERYEYPMFGMGSEENFFVARIHADRLGMASQARLNRYREAFGRGSHSTSASR